MGHGNNPISSWHEPNAGLLAEFVIQGEDVGAELDQNSKKKAVLGTKVDGYGNVQGRIVRKETYISPARQCADATRFVGDPKVKDGLVPLEYRCQVKVQSRPEATNIVKALKCEVDIER